MRAVHRKMRRINSVAFVRQMRAKWGRMDAMARFRRLLQEKVGTMGGKGRRPWGEMCLDPLCMYATYLAFVSLCLFSLFFSL